MNHSTRVSNITNKIPMIRNILSLSNGYNISSYSPCATSMPLNSPVVASRNTHPLPVSPTNVNTAQRALIIIIIANIPRPSI